MDSEDSRDVSSGNESDDKDQKSDTSGSRSRDSNARSAESRSRSSSAASRAQSRSSRSHPLSPDSRPQSPQNGIRSRSSDAHSAPSRSSSSDEDDGSCVKSRPQTPKSPESVCYQEAKIHSPVSPTDNSRSPQSVSPFENNIPVSAPSSPFPHNSSRSGSPGSPTAITKSPASDNNSIKSVSSHSSKKSRSSRCSARSSSTRGSRKSRKKSNDGNSSDSSESSVDSSSRKNKNISKVPDTQPEEISDGDMESEHEKEVNIPIQSKAPRAEINISHEDLSDVSDLEDSIGDNFEDDGHKKLDIKLNIQINESDDKSPEVKKVSEKNNRPEEGEEQLDFEAEDGECGEVESVKEKGDAGNIKNNLKEEISKDEENEKEKEELEEGEVTDEDDARPEETEPRPVCRFFSRGQCTWGASCRFLHPGVTDKDREDLKSISKVNATLD